MASTPFKEKLTKVPQFVSSSKALETEPNKLSGYCLKLDSADPNPLLVKAIGAGGLLKLVQPDSGREVLVAVQPFVERNERLQPTSDISQEEFGELLHLTNSVEEQEFAVGKTNASILQEDLSRQGIINVIGRPHNRRQTNQVSTTALPPSLRQPYLLLPSSHLRQFNNLNFTPLSEVLQRLRRTHQEALSEPQLFSVSRPSTSSPSPPASPPCSRRRADILEQLETFAANFRRRRIELGFSQYDFQYSMKKLYNISMSQTTLSRFEALKLSIRNMRRLRPILDRWMQDVRRAAVAEQDADPAAAEVEAEEKEGKWVEFSASGRAEPLRVRVDSEDPPGWEPLKQRRKRTKLSSHEQAILVSAFEKTPRPSVEKIATLASHLSLSRSVVRAWFCNRKWRSGRLKREDTQSASQRLKSNILNLASDEIGTTYCDV